jgi:nitrilase
MQHIAREGGLFVVSACMALRMDDIPDEYGFKKLYPSGREWINPGNSCIISPKGKILAGPMEAEEGLLFADLDLREVLEAKRMFDAVGHYARPDVFQFSLNSQTRRQPAKDASPPT